MVQMGDHLPAPAEYDLLFKTTATLLPQIVDQELLKQLHGAERVYENAYAGGRFEIRGGFGVVYLFRLHDKANWRRDEKIVALRVYARKWRVPNSPHQVGNGYAEVDRFFRGDTNLAEATVPVTFFPEALRVPGWEERLPVVLMDWAGPDTMLDFVGKRCAGSSATSRPVLRALAEHWRRLMTILSDPTRQIEHGDISPTNVIVRHKGRGLTLIDYDFVWLRAQNSSSVSGIGAGQWNYLHPVRHVRVLSSAYSGDPFAALVIYTSLLALAERPDLWHARRRRWQGFERPGNVLLFTQEDLAEPDKSWIFQEIRSCAESRVLSALRALREACYRQPEELPGSLDGLLKWEERADPPLEAWVSEGRLRVRWRWRAGWADRLVLMWSGDGLPIPGQRGERRELTYSQSIRLGEELDLPPIQGVSRYDVALYEIPSGVVTSVPPDRPPLVQGEAREICTVQCQIIDAPGAASIAKVLEIWSSDGQPLPRLMIVRRVGNWPEKSFGYRVEACVATDRASVMLLLTAGKWPVAYPSEEWPARYPPGSELRVLPARPEDRGWVRIDTIGTKTARGRLIKGRLILD